ncbi:MAG: type II secretion system protein GspC [Gammaproteobacteria bacterium]|nr:type II secretion system protein GspC [Gammaproteobacteria bacterium]MCP5423624.1 type II secretion system protein GspC [Gammaproteobacteria bacterium]
MRRWRFPNNLETLGRLAAPVNVLLVILLAHGLARLTWTLLPVEGSALTQPDAPVLQAPPKPADYAAIADWHLFGQVNAPTLIAAPTQNVPETRLNLRLAGIFFTPHRTKGRALIAPAGGAESSYAVGDRLPGGAHLVQILRDQVILSRNGVLEALKLPKETPLAGVPDNAPTTLPTARANAVADNVAAPIDASAVVGQLRGEVANRPQALEDLAFASPYQQDGQFIGFRLRPGRDRKLMAQLGLRSGDVVTEVNGVRLVDPAQGLTVMQELLNADQIAIQVLRDGAEIPLTFALSSAPN